MHSPTSFREGRAGGRGGNLGTNYPVVDIAFWFSCTSSDNRTDGIANSTFSGWHLVSSDSVVEVYVPVCDAGYDRGAAGSSLAEQYMSPPETAFQKHREVQPDKQSLSQDRARTPS